jgi:hypothetical protein
MTHYIVPAHYSDLPRTQAHTTPRASKILLASLHRRRIVVFKRDLIIPSLQPWLLRKMHLPPTLLFAVPKESTSGFQIVLASTCHHDPRVRDPTAAPSCVAAKRHTSSVSPSHTTLGPYSLHRSATKYTSLAGDAVLQSIAHSRKMPRMPGASMPCLPGASLSNIHIALQTAPTPHTPRHPTLSIVLFPLFSHAPPCRNSWASALTLEGVGCSRATEGEGVGISRGRFVWHVRRADSTSGLI